MTSISDNISKVLNAYYENSKNVATDATATDKVAETAKTEKVAESNTSLKRYFDSTSSDEVDAKKIFEKLSIDMGGDTAKITEEELNSYISDAKAGKVVISDEELEGLTELKDNWDAIADGADSINYYNVSSAGYDDALLSMAPEEPSDTMISELKALGDASTIEAYSSIVTAALGSSTNVDGSTSGLTNLLNNLLKGNTDENDDANANLIATLTNLLSGATSTISKEA